MNALHARRSAREGRIKQYLWGLLAVATTACLGWFYYVGYEQTKPGTAAAADLKGRFHNWDFPSIGFHHLLDRQGALQPSSAVIVGILVVVAVAWRNMRLHRLAWAPGPIELSVVDVGGKPDPELTARFRAQLVELDLSRQAPVVPGTPQPEDVLQLLDQTSLEKSKAMQTVAQLLRYAWPQSALRAQGSIVELPDRRWQMTIGFVSSVRRQGLTVAPAGATQAEALEFGALAVAAQILPGTRRFRTREWRAWLRSDLTAELLHHHRRAARLHQERRFDEALGAYRDARDLDPHNLDIRLRMAQLEEQLGLYIDALETYWNALELVSTSPLRGRRRRFPARDHLVLRYRYAVLLGFSEKVADQWLAKPEQAGAEGRDERRAEIRGRLGAELAGAYRPARTVAARVFGRRAIAIDPAYFAAAVEPLLTGKPFHLGAEPDDVQKLLVLRLFFSLAAQREVRLLRRRLWLRSRRYQDQVTRPVTALLRALADVRLNIAQRLIQERVKVDEQLPSLSAVMGRQMDVVLFPPPFQDVRKVVEGTRSGLRRGAHDFAARYNAACLYAVALYGKARHTLSSDAPHDEIERLLKPREDEYDLFAWAAVGELEQALNIDGHELLTSRRDWLLNDDPDLVGLRTHPQFALFEQVHFSERADHPVGVPRFENTIYSARIERRFARLMEDIWHQREVTIRQGALDPHTLMLWVREERDGWRLAQRLAAGYRHWPTRLEVVTTASAWAAKYHLTVGPFQQEAFERVRLEGGEPDVLVDGLRGGLAKLAALDMTHQLADYERVFENLDRSRPSPTLSVVHGWAEQRARLWRALHQSLRVGQEEFLLRQEHFAPTIDLRELDLLTTIGEWARVISAAHQDLMERLPAERPGEVEKALTEIAMLEHEQADKLLQTVSSLPDVQLDKNRLLLLTGHGVYRRATADGAPTDHYEAWLVRAVRQELGLRLGDGSLS